MVPSYPERTEALRWLAK
jgi:hypothetical protein